MTQTINTMRMRSLRSRLDTRQQEKSRLIAEITATATAPRRRQEAMVRYTSLVQDIRQISNELDTLQAR
jgi:Tfp pilus assembly protein PilN